MSILLGKEEQKSEDINLGQSQNELLTKIIETNSQEILKLKLEKEQITFELSQKIGQLNSEIEIFKSQMQTRKNELNDISNQKLKLESEKTFLESKVEKLENKNIKLNSKISQLQETNENNLNFLRKKSFQIKNTNHQFSNPKNELRDSAILELYKTFETTISKKYNIFEAKSLEKINKKQETQLALKSDIPEMMIEKPTNNSRVYEKSLNTDDFLNSSIEEIIKKPDSEYPFLRQNSMPFKQVRVENISESLLSESQIDFSDQFQKSRNSSSTFTILKWGSNEIRQHTQCTHLYCIAKCFSSVLF